MSQVSYTSVTKRVGMEGICHKRFSYLLQGVDICHKEVSHLLHEKDCGVGVLSHLLQGKGEGKCLT